METYLTLLLLGTALFVLEIFVPGGIAGLVGGLLCLLAAWRAVATFDGWIGLALALLAIVVACGMVFLVVRVFPSTHVGRKLSLPTDLKESRADDLSLSALKGAEGVADTQLRPAGFATLGGRRVDVVTRGDEIPAGAAVRVVDVEGNRVVVERR
jgi:membrane-bound serine protease (ClpP class)